MKKIGVLILISLLLLMPSVLSLFEKTKGDVQSGGEFKEINQNDQSLSQQLEIQIQSSISTGSTVNLASPEYHNNPSVVKRVLKEKFNMDINSFTGVTIEAGILKVGTSEIDLQAGKQIKLEIQGNTIIKYEDGETIILNAEGVKIDSTTKEVKKAEAVKDGETDIQFLQTYKNKRKKKNNKKKKYFQPNKKHNQPLPYGFFFFLIFFVGKKKKFCLGDGGSLSV